MFICKIKFNNFRLFRRNPQPFIRFNRVLFAEVKRKNFKELKDEYIVTQSKRNQTQSGDKEQMKKVN